MSEVNPYKFPIKLTGESNYHEWEVLFRQQCKEHDVWDETTSAPIAYDDFAFNLLIMNLDENAFVLVYSRTECPAQGFKLLKSQFGKSLSNIAMVLSEATNYKASNDLNGFFDSLKQFQNRLTTFNDNQDTISIATLISSLALKKLSLIDKYSEASSDLSAAYNDLDLDIIKDRMDIVDSAILYRSKLSSQVSDPPGPIEKAHKKDQKEASPAACEHFKNASLCWVCHPEKRPECLKCKSLKKKYYHKTGARGCAFKNDKKQATVKKGESSKDTRRDSQTQASTPSPVEVVAARSANPVHSEPEEEYTILCGYEHMYAHHNPQRYVYIGKMDGEPAWADFGPNEKKSK